MFLSKNRRKSGKKMTKVDKQREANLSMKVCKQKTITNSRMIAGSKVVISNSDQRSTPNKNTTNSNSVEQYSYTESISSTVIETSASVSITDSNVEISTAEKVDRRTYSLEKVSKSLDQVMASGKAILEALASVNGSQLNTTEGNAINTNVSSDCRADLKKRGTYDLDTVSNLLNTSVNDGKSLEASLNDISQEYSSDGVSNSGIKRGTYDLDAVSKKLDQSSEESTSLQDILYELSSDSAQNVSNSSVKRGTYDLEAVESTLDKSLKNDGIRQETLQQTESNDSAKFCQYKRGTYDLTELSDQLDHGLDICTSTPSHATSDRNNDIGKDGLNRRGTYNLSDVSDILDDSVTSGKSVDESLDRISSIEQKRKTYDLSESNLGLIEQSFSEDISDNNNIITVEKQLHKKSDKIKHRDLKLSDNSSTDETLKSEKRNTYVLESNENSEMSEEDYNDAQPVDNVLVELGLDMEDGKQETELTPDQWIKQMKGVKSSIPPTVPSMSPSVPLSSLKLTVAPKGMSTTEQNTDVTPVTKQRSQTVSGASTRSELTSQSESKLRSRSVSDSKVKARLKSSSSPNITTNTSSLKELPTSTSLEDISPGIRNYLANKLGLSTEQCLAVHRRLSSSSVVEASKLENRKTYSLDDVAHSLDIATSQGLPMTKVLDTLDPNTTETSAKTKERPETTDATSSNLETTKNESSLVNSEFNNPKPNTLDLESNSNNSKISAHRKTYIKVNGSSFVESPVGKSPTIDTQFKLVRKKAVYKPSAKLQSFSHLLDSKGGQASLRRTRGRTDPLKRNTYTLESVAESLEKAQDEGVTMLDALKRLSGMMIYTF